MIYFIIMSIFISIVFFLVVYNSNFLIWVVKNIAFQVPKDTRKKEYSVNGILVKTNLVYESNYSRNFFDMYFLERSTENLPLIIWVHGGGLIGGDKKEIETYALNLAQFGYRVIVMNYELVPKAVFPQPVEQVQDLIFHLLKNIDEYQIDVNNIFIAGDSAGAQIVSQFIVEQTGLHCFMETKTGFLEFRGVLLFCGAYNWINITQKSDSKLVRYISKKIARLYFNRSDWMNGEEVKLSIIANQISEKFPPTYITDGNTRSFEAQSKELACTLRNNNVDVRERFFEKNIETKHEYQFDLNLKAAQTVFDDVVAFLKFYRK